MCPALDGGDVRRTRCAPPLTSRWSPIPVTYAGGARNMEDCALIDKLGGGKVDATIGSLTLTRTRTRTLTLTLTLTTARWTSPSAA